MNTVTITLSPMQMLVDFYYNCGLIVGKEKSETGYVVSIKVGMADVIQGYEGFQTDFFFDEGGNFLYQKIWE